MCVLASTIGRARVALQAPRPDNLQSAVNDLKDAADAVEQLRDALNSEADQGEERQREYRVNAHDGIHGPFLDVQAALSELGEHQADWEENDGLRPPELESREVGPWKQGRCLDQEEADRA
jgi:hypothetical protein